jgi:uncharacterized membrane protein
VVLFSEIVGIVLLVPVASAVNEAFPGTISLIQAALAGALGSLGLLLLYHAFAIGTMSIAAPISATMAVILPVVVGAFTEGTPPGLILMGFAFALLAVWFVSQNQEGPPRILGNLVDLRLPLFAGIGFGCYFVLMHSAARESTLWPMVISRCAGLLVISLFMLVRRDSYSVPGRVLPMIALNGILDIGGNAFYILAGQNGRMDVSAALSSLYPGITVLMAWLILKERLSHMQWLGIGSALIAIVLFTL